MAHDKRGGGGKAFEWLAGTDRHEQTSVGVNVIAMLPVRPRLRPARRRGRRNARRTSIATWPCPRPLLAGPPPVRCSSLARVRRSQPSASMSAGESAHSRACTNDRDDPVASGEVQARAERSGPCRRETEADHHDTCRRRPAVVVAVWVRRHGVPLGVDVAVCGRTIIGRVVRATTGP